MAVARSTRAHRLRVRGCRRTWRSRGRARPSRARLTGAAARPDKATEATGIGPDLYGLVAQYAAIGHHRTGTPEDAAGLDWLHAELIRSGASVRRHTYEFERYDAHWECLVDGEEVPALPLYYEAVGHVATKAPHVAELSLDQLDLGGPHRFERRFDAIRAQAGRVKADAIVCAIAVHEHQRLAVPNRRVARGGGIPTLLVPASNTAHLRAAEISIRVEATVTAARSSNILASFGKASADPLVIATPLSGWFEAAGERGTGIVIALHLARALAARVPVLAIFTTGHEFEDLGLRRLINSEKLQPRAVLHVGASVAAGVRDAETGQLRHSDRRWKRSSVERGGPQITAALEELPGEFIQIAPERSRDPESWAGEAREWCSYGAPILSIAGVFPLFHALGDTPERSTSPELLASSYDGISHAAEILADLA